MYPLYKKSEKTVYQLISSPAVLRAEERKYNTVYSILSVQMNCDVANTVLVYDVAREKEVGKKILSEVIKNAPSEDELFDFIAELL